jgi:hypothetical protein
MTAIIENNGITHPPGLVNKIYHPPAQPVMRSMYVARSSALVANSFSTSLVVSLKRNITTAVVVIMKTNIPVDNTAAEEKKMKKSSALLVEWASIEPTTETTNPMRMERSKIVRTSIAFHFDA